MAGALLGHLLGPLQPRVAARGQLVRFNQSRFWPAGSKACNATCSKNGDRPCTGMFHDGLVYIPTRCSVADIPPPNWCGGGCDPHNRTANPPPVANGSIRDCKIHVVYPGCGCCINEGPAGYDIPKYAGFNEHAESNGIIVLYPQQDGGGIPNPCWDSIKDPNQSNRKGLQMNVVNRMVDWLGGAAAATPTGRLKADDSVLPWAPPPLDSPALLASLRNTSRPKLAYSTYIGWYEDGGLNESTLFAQVEVMSTQLRSHGWDTVLHDYGWQVCVELYPIVTLQYS